MGSNPPTAPGGSVAALIICPRCQREMVLFGIETETDKRDLYTFQCENCDHLEVRGVRIR